MTPFDTPQPWMVLGVAGLGALHLWASLGMLKHVAGSGTAKRVVHIDLCLFLALIAASMVAWLVAIPGTAGAVLQVAPFVYSLFSFGVLAPLIRRRRSQPSP